MKPGGLRVIARRPYPTQTGPTRLRPKRRSLAETGTVAWRRPGSQAREVLPAEEAIARLSAEAVPPDLRQAGDETRAAA
jgi:hypothetical protein